MPNTVTLTDMRNQIVANSYSVTVPHHLSHEKFKNAARRLQIWWRKNVLCVDYEKYENVLKKEDAQKGLVFFDGFRREILEYLKRPVEKTSSAPSGQMLTNLLRSEHIPYNIFFPMQYDKEGCCSIFNKLIGREEIKYICDIKIEYHPEPISEYLNDHTAFDVFISYQNFKDEICGIGIEVKYTEKDYPLKVDSTEYKHLKDKNGNTCLSKEYAKATKQSGWFKDDVEDSLIMNKYRQIWRNHILGASMILHGDIKNFYSVTLFPELNSHFLLDAMPKYKGTMGELGLLSEIGYQTCIPLTYEFLFELMEKYLKIEHKKEWIKYLRDRYLFTALDCIDR